MSILELIKDLIPKLESEQKDFRNVCVNSHNTPRFSNLDTLINLLYTEKFVQEHIALNNRQIHTELPETD